MALQTVVSLPCNKKYEIVSAALTDEDSEVQETARRLLGELRATR
jgi:hypothetical protein